jgi:hypothetical protein
MSTSKILIRSVEGLWHLPTSVPFASEDALHTLLQQSPELLPWSDAAPVVVARELAVPLTGHADLIFVSAVGEISVVECKLSSNSEMRRHVVGQVFAYASGIAQMTYEQLDSAFVASTNRSLMDAMAETVLSEDSSWNAETFRSSVAANLAAGRMGLLIAVDGITEELKRIVEFINSHTTSALRVMALELSLVKDGDMEILLPTVFGEESVRIKPSTVKPTVWDETTFFPELIEACKPETFAAFRRLYDHAARIGAGLSWGPSLMPNVGGRYIVGGKSTTLWNCYVSSDRRARLDMNFNHIVGPNVSPSKLQNFLQTLSGISGVGEKYSEVDKADFKRRPPVTLDVYFADKHAVEVVMKAIDDLVAPTESPAIVVE